MREHLAYSLCASSRSGHASADQGLKKAVCPRPTDEHHGKQKHTPQSGGKMLVGAEQVEARGDHLQDDERNHDRNDAPEATKRIDAAKEAGKHGDQQERLAMA